ncbi:MAG: hypothetical protein ABIW03_04545 [Sphingomicrobium sp.]
MPRNQSNRGGTRRGNNNNPEGKNQYNNGLLSAARDRPATAALTAAGAVAAGVFLWSRRSQISDQISQLSDQIGEWTDQMTSDRGGREFEAVGSGSGMPASSGKSGSFTSASSAFDSPSADSSAFGATDKEDLAV